MRISLRGYWRSIPIVVYMLACMLPLVSRTIGTGLLAAVIIFLMVGGITRRIIIADRDLIALFFLFAIYIVIEYLRVRNAVAIGNLYENILFFIPLLYYTISAIDTKVRDIVLVSFFAIQTYVAIINSVLLVNDPSLCKYMTGGVGYVVSGYYNTNLGSVSNVFLSTLIPIFIIILFKKIQKRYIRVLLLIIFAINALYVILARSFLCVAILILGIVLFLCRNEKHRKVVIAFSILFSLLVLLLFSGTIREVVSGADFTFEYKNRIIDLLDWVTGTNQIGNLEFINGRVSDYLTSISTFIKHPLFGIGMVYTVDVSVVGMHSELLDFLARYGLIGAALCIAMIKRYYSVKEVTNSFNSRHMLVIVALYLALNPCISRTSGIAFFWIVPMLIAQPTKGESNDINSLK